MISVIVPVYKAQYVLKRCIDSILCQTYTDYEIILIDDGSIDDSATICDVFAFLSPNIRVVHQRNGGVSKARNTGMSIVSGEYFVCVDSDDWVKKDYLFDFVQYKKAYPMLGHIWCGFESLTNNKEYVFSKMEEFSIQNRDDYFLLSEKILTQSPCNHLYQTDIVQNNHLLMSEDIDLGEDLVFNLDYLDVLVNKKIGIINKTNYVYNDEDDTTLNSKYRSDLLDNFKLLDSIMLQYLKKWGIFNSCLYHRVVYNHYVMVMENTMKENNPSSLKEKYEYNDSILTSHRFKYALKMSGIKINPILKWAYRSEKYTNVIFFNNLSKLKHIIFK